MQICNQITSIAGHTFQYLRNGETKGVGLLSISSLGRQFIQKSQRMLVFRRYIGLVRQDVVKSTSFSLGSEQLLDVGNTFEASFLENLHLQFGLGNVTSGFGKIGLVVTHLDVIKSFITRDIELPIHILIPGLGLRICTRSIIIIPNASKCSERVGTNSFTQEDTLQYLQRRTGFTHGSASSNSAGKREFFITAQRRSGQLFQFRGVAFCGVGCSQIVKVVVIVDTIRDYPFACSVAPQRFKLLRTQLLERGRRLVWQVSLPANRSLR